VSNLTSAKAIIGALTSADLVVDEPYYAQYNVADQEMGLDPNGHQRGMSGPVGYWHVDDIHGLIDTLVASGATIDQPVQDVGGPLIVTLKDGDGNPIGLLQST
jgi:predicted enzyme related to lactoylglutathione lyase